MTTNRLFSAGVEWANKNHQRAASMTATNQAITGSIGYTVGQPDSQATKGPAPRANEIPAVVSQEASPGDL